MLKVIDHGKVREIRMASLAGRLTGYQVSAFLHDGVLIDTGLPRARRSLTRWLDAHPVRGVIVTHWHEDHAGNLALLVARGVPATVQARTLELLPRIASLPPYRRLVWGEAPPVPSVPGPAPHRFEILPTPGHSEDHVAVWDPEDRILFLGDLFLGVRACTMHRGEDPYALLDSIERMIALQPVEAFCAHRGRLRDPVRALEARARWLDHSLREVERLVDEDWTDRAITFQVLGAERLGPLLTSGELARRHFVEAVRAELARIEPAADPGPVEASG